MTSEIEIARQNVPGSNPVIDRLDSAPWRPCPGTPSPQASEPRHNGSALPKNGEAHPNTHEAAGMGRLEAKAVNSRPEGPHPGQAEMEAIYEGTPFMMCVINSQRHVERMNRTMVEFVGAEPSATKPQGLGDLLACLNSLENARGCGASERCNECPLRLAMLRTLISGQPCRQIEARLRLARGGARREICVSASTAVVRLQDQLKVLVCLEDITMRKEIESQLLQSHKMEAIGKLAGGIAHDFNNILAATLLHLQILQQEPGLEPSLAAALRELEEGNQRAAQLTRQLLLFSRRQVMQTRRVDFSEAVKGLTKMLRRLLREDIDMTFTPSEEPAWVEADAGMLEQVVMNLCINARDAMPKGGQLTLGVARSTLSAEDLRPRPGVRPGAFACFTATDTGCGMDEASLKRIFEPFFTTKEPGKGTGLGLATVDSIIRQHRGWVEAQSAVGRGTTFRVFLPLAEPPATAQARTGPTQTQSRGGSETILLVEDDQELRRMVRITLGLLGYEILEASNGVEAMRVWEHHGSRVNLIFTDMVMPGGFTGLDVAQRMRQVRPDLKVVISSGYTADLLQQGGRLPAGMKFLAKPYEPDKLIHFVRECLDERN